ncbi:hypothetical protein OPQ81_008146 [Rhizoctonia solani]|nr:hypothetical protein OPQ81_008146 [Rhizoctonia solani]
MVTNSNVSFEGELMHQIVSAMPISGNHSFHVVRGSASKHLLFSIGDTGQLYLIRPDDSMGRCSLIDIGTLFGIPRTSVISALAVTQSSDLSIYIAFTVDGPSKDSVPEIKVVRPTQPSEWESISNTDISTWLLSGESDSKLRTYKLYLGPTIGENMSYPLLVAVYTNLDRNVTDVTRLDVNIPDSRWSFDHSFRLPADPKLLVDACCGYLAPNIHGMFCLYEIQGNIRLSFTGLAAHSANFSLQVRPDAKSLATFINPGGYTDLLVGGSHLYHYPAAICVDSFPPNEPEHFNVTSTGPMMSGLQQLFVSQEGLQISVFTLNGENSIIYQQFTIKQEYDKESATLKLLTPPVPLLTSEQGGGHFTVLFDAATGSQFLYILDSAGQLTFMEQSGGTRIWQTHPILVPSSDVNRDITTFTTHVHLAGPNGASLAYKSFLLSSSSPVSMNVNGRSIYATPGGVTVKTDSCSNLTIIHQVDDISTVSFTLRDSPTEPETLLGRSYTYDPSTKILGKLGSLTADKLRNATLPDGRKLLPDSVSNSEVENAATILSQLHSSARTLASGTEQGSGDPGSDGRSTSLSNTSSGEHSSSFLWDIWHWVSNSVNDIKNFFIDAWGFVVETAKGVYRFVLKAVSHVMKAVSWVFKKLCVGLKDLVEFLGFLFNWSDILDMHNILVGVTNCALDVVADSAKSGAAYVDSCFGKFEELVNGFDPTSKDYDHSVNLKGGPGENKSSNDVTGTPAGNWSNYQIEHGGVGKAMQGKTSETTASPETTNVFSQLWTDILSPALQSLAKLASHLMENLQTLLSNCASLKLGDIIQHLGIQLLRDIINVMRKVVIGLIEFCGHLVEDIKVGLNAKIDVPLLGPLYRRISGNELSMLDAMALLAAVPITVSYKAITGKRPRDIKSLAHLLTKPAPNNFQIQDQKTSPGFHMNVMNAHAICFLAIPESGDSSKDNSVIEASQEDISPSNTVFWGIWELYRFALPMINLISIPWTTLKWYIPDPDTRFEAEYFQVDPDIDPTKVFKPDVPLDIALQIFAALLAFPLDVLPFKLPFDVPEEPAPFARTLTWVLESLIIPVKIVFRRKRSIALLSTLLCLLQIPTTCTTIYQDLSADEGQFPGRDGVIVGLAATQNACSLVAKISGNIALHVNGVDPWSFWIAIVASELTCVSQQFIAIREYETHASYTSLRSLVGN